MSDGKQKAIGQSKVPKVAAARKGSIVVKRNRQEKGLYGSKRVMTNKHELLSKPIDQALSLSTMMRVHEMLVDGVPVTKIKSNPVLTSALINNGIIARRTLGTVEKRKDKVLPDALGEKFARAERIEALANEVIGEHAAMDWLCRKNEKFNNRKPIELMKFESGARAVELYLNQLMHGFNA